MIGAAFVRLRVRLMWDEVLCARRSNYAAFIPHSMITYGVGRERFRPPIHAKNNQCAIQDQFPSAVTASDEDSYHRWEGAFLYDQTNS